MRTFPPIEERLWSRCTVRGECLLYLDEPDRYHAIYWNKKRWLAHRVAFLLCGGKLAPGQHTLHSCDTPGCCNPNHLRAGNCKDNTADMMARGRENPARGERHHRAKLTADQVAEIRAHPRGYKFLAKLYGVKWRAIQKIKTGQRWKGVAGADVIRSGRGSRHRKGSLAPARDTCT